MFHADIIAKTLMAIISTNTAMASPHVTRLYSLTANKSFLYRMLKIAIMTASIIAVKSRVSVSLSRRDNIRIDKLI